MRYAEGFCRFSQVGSTEISISGPYYDNPNAMRSVTVKIVDLEAYVNGKKKFVQDAFPYLSADDREFLISGMSPDGFDELFKE